MNLPKNVKLEDVSIDDSRYCKATNRLLIGDIRVPVFTVDAERDIVQNCVNMFASDEKTKTITVYIVDSYPPFNIGILGSYE